MELTAGLESLGSHGAPQAAERVRAALTHSGQAATRPEEAAQLDDAVILALKRAASTDAILAGLDVDALFDLLVRTTRRVKASGAGDEASLRRSGWEVLDLVRRTAVLRRIEPERRESWSEKILDLVEASHLTMGPLFRHRAELYGSKPLFELQTGGRKRVLSWRQVASRVE